MAAFAPDNAAPSSAPRSASLGSPLIGAVLLGAVALIAAFGLTLGSDRLLPLMAAAAVLLVGGVVVLRLGPQVLLVGLLVTGYFSGYAKLRYGSMLGYVAPEALCLLLIAYTLLSRQGRSLPLPRTPLTVAILALSVYCVLCLFNPDSPLVRSVFGLRSWLLYMWLVFAGYELLRDERQLRQVLITVLLLSIFAAAYGLYQWKLGPAALTGYTAALDNHAARMNYAGQDGTSNFRAFSLFTLPGAFGSNMAAGLVLAMVLFTSRGTARWVRVASLLGAPLMLGGLLVSGSRGPLVFLMIGVVVFLCLRRLQAVFPALLVSVAGLMAGVAVATPAVVQRFSTVFDPVQAFLKWYGPMTVGLGVAVEYPFGRGLGYTAGVPALGFAAFNTMVGESNQLNVDSGIGAAAAELGWVGLALYMGLVFTMAVVPLRTWKSLPDGSLKDQLLFPVAMAMIFALTCVIAVPHAQLPWSIYLWTLVGMLLKAPQLAYQQQVLAAEQARLALGVAEDATEEATEALPEADSVRPLNGRRRPELEEVAPLR